MKTLPVALSGPLSERRFYGGMAIAMLLSVIVGFARSFFFRPFFPEHPAPPETIFYIHGAVFSLWIVLFVSQVFMIAGGHVKLHRRIGTAGAVVALVMLALGVMSAFKAAIRPSGFIGIPVPPLQFLAVPLFDMILFAGFITMAFAKKRDSPSHKRWMVLATLNLITAAIARWPVIGALGPLAYFFITDLFVVALVVWDFRERGRIHAATLWGGAMIIISQPLRLAISGSDAWLTFATWATQLVR